MKRRLLLMLFPLIVFISCQKSESPSADMSEPMLRIKASPVVRMDMIDTVRIYGEVKLRQDAHLASQFDGRLTDFALLLGDRVKKGEKIGTIIPPQREALMQTLQNIAADLRPMLEKQIKSIPLFSPINGVALEVLQHNGDVVQKGETIVHIGDLGQLDVHGELPIRYLPLVRKMKAIDVMFVNYPHAKISLPVEAVSGKVDEAKQTVSIRLRLNNRSGEFRPGMQVQLMFPGQAHKGTLVMPRAALLEEEGVYSAFVVKGKTVEKRHITLGILHPDRVEVLTGLNEGEQVATKKAYSLTDGMEVTVE